MEVIQDPTCMQTGPQACEGEEVVSTAAEVDSTAVEDTEAVTDNVTVRL